MNLMNVLVKTSGQYGKHTGKMSIKLWIKNKQIWAGSMYILISSLAHFLTGHDSQSQHNVVITFDTSSKERPLIPYWSPNDSSTVTNTLIL